LERGLESDCIDPSAEMALITDRISFPRLPESFKLVPGLERPPNTSAHLAAELKASCEDMSPQTRLLREVEEDNPWKGLSVEVVVKQCVP